MLTQFCFYHGYFSRPTVVKHQLFGLFLNFLFGVVCWIESVIITVFDVLLLLLRYYLTKLIMLLTMLLLTKLNSVSSKQSFFYIQTE